MNDIERWKRFNKVLCQVEELSDMEKLIIAKYILNEVVK